jgi:hypothetical protein
MVRSAKMIKKHKKQRNNELIDDENLKAKIKYYMNMNKITYQNAVRELIEKGYNYWLLERKYGENARSLEIWDPNRRLLKVEAGFLYYRLRTRELIEELKNIIFILSGVLADLENCYKTCKNSNININDINGFRQELKRYMNEYVLSAREELERGEYRYIDNWDEFLKEIEKLLKKYKNNENNS